MVRVKSDDWTGKAADRAATADSRAGDRALRILSPLGAAIGLFSGINSLIGGNMALAMFGFSVAVVCGLSGLNVWSGKAKEAGK